MAANSSRPIPGWLIPVAVAAVGVAGLLWLRPSLVTSTATSWRAWVFIALVAAAATLIPRLVRRARGPEWLGRVLGLLPVVAALVWTVLPAFRTTTVDEPLVAAVTAASASPSAPAGRSVATEVGSAALHGIGHRASGRVRLIRLAGGSYVVQLEGLRVEAGPDYLVYLVPGAGREKPDAGVRLARLKANRGNQNYPVPAGSTVGGPQTVLIWCRAFTVPIAAATVG